MSSLKFSMGQKLVKAAAERLAPRGGTTSHRPDLYMADHQPVTKDSARVMLGWASQLEQPSVEAVENWVMANLEGVKLSHETLKWHSQEHVATVVVGWLLPTRRLADADKMARVAPGKFLEANSKAVWEVRESEGEKFLVRTTKDDIDTLLAERKKQASKSGKLPGFHTVKSAGLLDVTKGDEVRFYHKGMVKMGRVLRQDVGEWIIKSGKDQCRVAQPAITEVKVKDPSTVGDYKKKVKDYYSKIFPAAYLNKWMSAGK